MLAALLVIAGCTVSKQDCPAAQYCYAEWDEAKNTCPDAGRCVPVPKAPDIELSFPIPAGERFYCAKGNLRAGSSTHSACSSSTRFAFDLAAPFDEPPRLILAAADGVAYGYGGCTSHDLNRQEKEDRCNQGWGNVVRVVHDGGLYTQYGHLSAILVRWGEPVKRGQAIGFEGNTGAAGAKHLHFSLHKGDPFGGGETLPIGALRVKGGIKSSKDIVCGDWVTSDVPKPESALVSDTQVVAAKAPRYGYYPPPPPIAEQVRMPNAQMFSVREEDRKAAIASLRALPDSSVVSYWLGAALQQDKQLDAAVVALSRAVAAKDAPAWLVSWSHVRLAEIALSMSDKVTARANLDRVVVGDDTELAKRVAALVPRLR